MIKHAQVNQSQTKDSNCPRPRFKSFRVRMSPGFLEVFVGHNILSMVNNFKRIFLRLGFDGYEAIPEDQGYRIRLKGKNLNTGRYCDHHTVFRGTIDLVEGFMATIRDEYNLYQLELCLSREYPDTKREDS